MTTFSRVLRSGLVPVAEAFRPTSERGSFVYDKLKAIGNMTRNGFAKLLQEGYESAGARRRDAAKLVADLSQAFNRVGHEVDRLTREADEARDLVDGALTNIERGLTPLQLKRIERRSESLRGLSGPALRKVLDAAVIARDVDTLVAAYAENLEGGRQALAAFAVGEHRAQVAVELQRDALVLQQAHKCMVLGLQGMQNKPEEWMPETTGARPEERLAVLAAGSMGFFEVQQAARDRYESGLEQAAAQDAGPKPELKDQPEVDA